MAISLRRDEHGFLISYIVLAKNAPLFSPSTAVKRITLISTERDGHNPRSTPLEPWDASLASPEVHFLTTAPPSKSSRKNFPKSRANWRFAHLEKEAPDTARL